MLMFQFGKFLGFDSDGTMLVRIDTHAMSTKEADCFLKRKGKRNRDKSNVENGHEKKCCEKHNSRVNDKYKEEAPPAFKVLRITTESEADDDDAKT